MTRDPLQLSVRLLVLPVVLALVFFFVGSPADADAPIQTVEYVVEAGDTLWAIASDAADGIDPRTALIEIQELNGIEGGLIHPGQVILIAKG